MGGKGCARGRQWPKDNRCNVKKAKNKAGALKPADCPKALSADARERWHWLVTTAPAGALSVSDAGTVTVLACALVLHEQAAAKVAEFGPVVLAGTKADVNPWVGILNAQAAIISKASRDLGLKSWRPGAAGKKAAGAGGGTLAGKKEIARADAAATLESPAGEWGNDLNPNALN